MNSHREPVLDLPAATTRAGHVLLLGPPNAGKSSLLNRFLDQKLSIVTPLAQTTRERVVGIDTRGGVQMIFLDSPGLIQPRYLLHQSMLQAALQNIPDADALVLVLDAAAGTPKIAPEVLDALRTRQESLLVALNKNDLSTDAQLSALQAWADQTFGVAAFPVSAETGDGLDRLRQEIARLLPESPFLFDPEDVSDQPVRFFVAEFIRETAFELYKQEIPYSVAVRIDEFREGSDPLYIRATIYVERSSQKAVLVGRGGTAMRRLGQESRVKIEQFLATHVYLDLWVKVLPKWRKKADALRRLGYSVPENNQ